MPFITNKYSKLTFFVNELNPCGNCDQLEKKEIEDDGSYVEDMEFSYMYCNKWKVTLRGKYSKFGYLEGAFKDRRCRKIG